MVDMTDRNIRSIVDAHILTNHHYNGLIQKGEKVMKVAVFVNAVTKKDGRVIIEASNGSEFGPPRVIFETGLDQKPYIGKKYWFTIEEEENDR
jgi:hypothetical protein